MAYEAVLFDMNGVLVDDEHLQEAAFREVLVARGYPLSPEDYTKYFIGRTDKSGFENYFNEHTGRQDVAHLISQKGDAYQKLAAAGVKGYEGVLDFVAALHAKNIKLAVVTSSMGYEATAVLKGLGLTDYFEAVVAAEDVKNGKPDPEGYLKGASALSVRPEKCVVIEDAPSGLKAAKSARMYAIAVLNTHAMGELQEADIAVRQLSANLAESLLQKN